MSKLPFPERVLRQHIATLGKTGAGKSSAMRVIGEHLLDHKKRTCIVDPKGDWWGLKSSADGKSAGYPVICFGDFKEPRATDVPINPQSGKHVAELPKAQLAAWAVRILSRLSELMECTGQDKVPKAQLAAWAEYSPNSGGFNNYLGTLRSAGMIDYPAGGFHCGATLEACREKRCCKDCKGDRSHN
jgi:uncharacterized protein DUF87